MDSELLQSFVGQSNEDEQEQPSRLYQKQEKQEKKVRADTPSTPQPSNWKRNRKNVVVIEQKKVRSVALAIDESYCDKDRAASCSFGYLDIKQEFKQKGTFDRNKARIMPDDTDTMAFLTLGKKEIKAGHLESGVKFITKV
jgi:hypothetical protein